MLKYLIVIAVLFTSCESKSKTESKEVFKKPNPSLKLAMTVAAIRSAQALKASVGESVRKSRISLEKVKPNSSAYLNERSTVLSIVFSANIHGERIDCGCRKNPLGGLARQEKLFTQVTQKGKEWEPLKRNQEGALYLDAGDIYFKNVFDNFVEKEGETQSIYDAKSVAMAQRKMSVDVQNIGELDLVFGLDVLKELVALSKTKVVSANLFKDGKRVFKAFHIIEKSGKKVAIVGLTKQNSRKRDYYKQRELVVKDPKTEYEKVYPNLSEVDVVILLSNLGLPSTQALLKTLKNPPDLVVVSNSNRLTREPIFEKGIPVIEPSSRGKYLGRADLIINGKELAFANGGESKLKRLDNYARTYRNYLSSRIRYLRQIEKALLEQMEHHDVKQKPSENLEHSHKHGGKEPHSHTMNFNKFLKNAEVLEKRMTVLADELMLDTQALEGSSNMKGDDFIDIKIASVKLAYPESKRIKKLVDQREKRRPQSVKLPKH